ncbi:hypothetical protein Gotri_012837 [Gossypium trilobum]|uniref:MULE transposase domain-containing protein n=1 Tax=Gossypium trilobum TaxID=34281 RepID=A0A7J9DRK9_9ROSI|nr:hypothetical protein [Gossypium trilobum]
MSNFDVFDSDVSNRIRVNLDGLNMDDIEVGDLFDSDDSGRRAKLRALELIEGAHKAQYENIYEYLLEACKDGYRVGCRRIIGLDGCFLNGYFGGYLLAAVGIDANNGIYHIAYAAIESEKQASWLWFLELLALDLKIEKNPTHWSMSHFSVRSHSDMLVNNLSECFNKVTLEARGKPILTMMEIIRTNIMLLIVKKKKEADKIKGILGPNIKKKLDVNIKDSLSLGSQHVVDLVENSCSYRNKDLTSIPCMHVVAAIHLKYEFPETYVQTWYTKKTHLSIYSNFIRLVRGPKQRVSVLNMLPTLFPTLRRPPDIPTKVKRK